MAGKIIADTIEAQGSFISLNVAGQTVLTANSSGLAYLPTGNVTINVVSGATQFANLGITSLSTSGIKFPATQVASSDGNTLDDYEEGTWTPSLGGASYNYGSAVVSGYYVKIGRVVHASWTIQNFTWSGGGSQLTLSGLPFTNTTAANDASRTWTSNIMFYYIVDISTNPSMGLYLGSGATRMDLYTNRNASTWTTQATVSSGSSGYFDGQITYIANA